MTEQLDRIESILEATATQQAKNTESIDALIEVASANDVAIRELGVKVEATTANVDRLVRTTEETEQLFNAVRAEAQADRAETRRLWNDAITQMERDRAEAKAEREENARSFSAQQEVIQRLLVELVEMNRDNRRLRDRVDRLEAS